MLIMILRVVNEASAYYHWKKGVDCLYKKSYAQALKELSEAEKVFPENDCLQYDIAVALENEKIVDQAIKYYYKALSKNKHEKIYFRLTILSLISKQYIEAEKVLIEFRNKYPNRLLPLYLSALLYYNRNMKSYSLYYIEKIFKMKPKIKDHNSDFYKNQAILLKNQIDKMK